MKPRKRPARLPAAVRLIATALLVGGATFPPAAAGSPPGDADPLAQFEAATARGDSAAALEAARRAAGFRRQRLGARPSELAAALEALAIRVFQEAGGAAAESEAESLFREALAVRRGAFGDRHLEVAQSLDTLSTFHYFLGRFDEAEAEERQALEMRQSRLAEDHPLVAKARDGLGTILYKEGRFSEAEPLLLAALATFRAAVPPEPWRISDSLNVLAELARSRGDLGLAEERFHHALEVLGDDASVPWRAERTKVLNNLAGLYKDEGRYDRAEELLHRSLELSGMAVPPEKFTEATIVLNLAELQRLQGKQGEAAPLYARALGLARAALGDDNPELGFFLNQSAVEAREEGRFDDAERLGDEALQLLRATLGGEHFMVAQALHDRSRLEVDRGRPAEAERLLRQALAIRERVYGPGHPEVALTRLALAGTILDPAAARAEADAAVAGLEATAAYPDERAEALALRARLRRRAGDAEGAVADLRQATAIVELLRPQSGGGEAGRAGRFARHAVYFDDLALALLASGRTAEAFEVAERGRGRTLLDQIEAARLDRRAALPEAERGPVQKRELAAARLAEAQERVAAMRGRTDLGSDERAARVVRLEAELADAAAAFARAREAMLSASPLWRRTGGGAVVSLAETQERLVPRRGVLLLYLLGEEASGVLLIPPPPGLPVFQPLEADAEMARLLGLPSGALRAGDAATAIAAVAAALARPPASKALEGATEGGAPGERATLADRLHALWRLLLPEPVWRAVRRADEAIVLPDGPLHALPFEALIVKPGRTLAGARFFLDDGPPLRYASSAGLLRSLAGRATAGTGLVSVSDPDYAGSRLARLPGTARESAAVVAAVASRPASVEPVVALTRGEATEPRVRQALAGRRFLHLAVHGLSGARLGDLFSALALTPPSSPTGEVASDGFLQLFEIYELGLASELAVLSACDTQAGRTIEGEGVFALSRGFQVAGARRVVASLWTVDDASTAALMGEFFRKLGDTGALAGGPAAERGAGGYARALRNARRTVRARRDWASPYYWAPFILNGAP